MAKWMTSTSALLGFRRFGSNRLEAHPISQREMPKNTRNLRILQYDCHISNFDVTQSTVDIVEVDHEFAQNIIPRRWVFPVELHVASHFLLQIAGAVARASRVIRSTHFVVHLSTFFMRMWYTRIQIKYILYLLQWLIKVHTRTAHCHPPYADFVECEVECG